MTTAEPDRQPLTPAPGWCPYQVADPVMVQQWLRLTFLHWRFEPGDVQRLLPPGLFVETCDGGAWVGLVPFVMRVGLPGLPLVPWASRFCETNVRTYVTDAAGRSGIWFFSLDAARLGAVVVARTTYRLPYFWAAMSVHGDPPLIGYRSRRRGPGRRGVVSRARIEIGARYESQDLGPLDHFLTARWALFSVSKARHRYAVAEHRPWPLYRARAVEVYDELVTAAGLPPTQGPPLAHYSPGVEVKIGRPSE